MSDTIAKPINYRPVNMQICNECGKEFNAAAGECKHWYYPAEISLMKEAQRTGKSEDEILREAYNAAGPEDL